MAKLPVVLGMQNYEGRIQKEGNIVTSAPVGVLHSEF